ncbi:MAG: hypothetical protein GX811_12035 [Lentisphaerae bacterium]|nr:hypothetical protein [Lentisphaerota bacterium]
MKKLFPDISDVPQSMANKAIRIVDKHLRHHRVDRATDLSEEAKVRLLRDLRAFFENDPDKWEFEAMGGDHKNWLARIIERIEKYFNFDLEAVIIFMIFGSCASSLILPLIR